MNRPLITILYSLEAFGANLFDSRIKWYTDNQATAKIVEVGSMKLALQTLAYKIFSYCLAHNIDLHVQWIPRELNTQSGVISKLRDCIRNHWQIIHVTYFNNWIVHGGHIPWIVLLPFIMQKLSDFFRDSGTPAAVLG